MTAGELRNLLEGIPDETLVVVALGEYIAPGQDYIEWAHCDAVQLPIFENGERSEDSDYAAVTIYPGREVDMREFN